MNLWNDNSIQFPRLLAEIAATCDIPITQQRELCESMDITLEELDELFERAQDAWERIKYGTLAHNVEAIARGLA